MRTTRRDRMRSGNSARARVGRACERAYINHDLNGRYLVMIPGRAVSRSFLTYPRIFAKPI